jgi:hypothetical protein
MSEEVQKIEVMPNDKIVSIKVSGAFLSRVQSVLVYVLSNFETEKIKEAAEKIQKQQHTEPWEFHYETLAVLINDIERTARGEGLTEVKDVSELTQEESSTEETPEA